MAWRRAPLADRVCDAACAGFAAWTLSAHVVVFGGGNLYHLLFAAPVVGILAALAIAAATRGGRSPAGTSLSEARAPTLLRVRMMGVALGIAAVGLYGLTRDTVLLWWCTVALLTLAGALVLPLPAARVASAKADRKIEAALWALGLGCVALGLVAHRFAIDDAFYVNVAVAAADAPARGLFSGDTLLGLPGLSLHNPAHRVLTLELLNGALSLLTGFPALVCMHVVTAGIAGLLVPLSQARLFRMLLPENNAWLGAVVATTVVLIAAGDTHRAFGNYAFVRLWQGKAIFLTVALPLVYAYAIRFAATGTAGSWLLLCASQIASVGLTSTAVWAAPLAGGLALASQLRPDRRSAGILVRGVAACLYPVGIGLAIRSAVLDVIQIAPAQRATGAWLASSMSRVLGSGWFELAAVASVLLLWAVSRGSRLRRFAIFVPLGALLTVANPYLEGLIRSSVTGPSHWRTMWAIPFPLLLGLLLAAPWSVGTSHPLRRYRAPLAVTLLVVFALAVPGSTAFPRKPGAASLGGNRWSERRRFPRPVSIGFPGIKVDRRAFPFARLLADEASAEDNVIAPEDVGLWLGTIHDAPRPLCDRFIYMDFRKRALGNEEVARRIRLTRFSAAPRLDRASLEGFRAGLRRYDVRALLIRPVQGDELLRRLLREEGFTLSNDSDVLDLWVRRGSG